MKIDTVTAKLGKYIFYAVLLIELGIVLIDKSVFINPIEGRLFQITFALCVLKIAMTKYSLKEWLLMAAFLALGAVSYFVTDRNEIIRVVAFIAASKDIHVKEVMKVTFYITLAGVVCLIGLSLLGVMGDIYMIGDFDSRGILKRYCLGLGHPNALHCMVWALTTLGIYLYMQKLKWYHYLILELGNIGLYCLTQSRTGMICTTFSILAAFVIALFPSLKDKRWVYGLGVMGVLGCVFLSLLFAKYGYYQGPFTWLDQYLTGRLRWGYFYGNITKWSLFSVPENTVYIDLGLVRLFYWYGYIPGAVYVLANCLLGFWCYKKKDIAALILMVMFAAYSILEAHAISVYLARNYVLLLFVGIWSEVFLLKPGTEGYFWQVKRILGKKEETDI